MERACNVITVVSVSESLDEDRMDCHLSSCFQSDLMRLEHESPYLHSTAQFTDQGACIIF